MKLIAEVLVWLSIFLVFHSYVLFPAIIRFWAKSKKKSSQNLNPAVESDQLVSILMAAFNEEEVIGDKIRSILDGEHQNPIEILVGSDCSTDRTDEILSELASGYPDKIRFFSFTTRQGKPKIINQLQEKAKGKVLILTDANVIFDSQTIIELMKPFADPGIGLVDSQMKNLGERSSGISVQEKAYISREVGIKHHESVLWGAMMGPFGGCFAIRNDLFEPVPDNFLVDDFFLNMVVLEKGYQAINNPDAIVYEDVSNDIAIEYRRKIRIATGNFQNLARFKRLLWPPWKGIAFAFLSHKVIRWLGPFLYLIAFLSSLGLGLNQPAYLMIWSLLAAVILIPLIDFILKKVSIHISFLRFITHFCAMNLAMLVGFVRFRKGVMNNVWQPTKRNQ